MGTALFIVFGVVLAPMVIMAIFLLRGKGAYLIAGYNTMSKAEKERYDEKAMCRSVGKWLLGFLCCLLLIPAGVHFNIPWLIYGGIAVTLAGTAGFAVYANTGNRFRKNPSSEISGGDASKPGTGKAPVVIAAVTSAIVLVALGVLFFQGDKDPAVHVHEDYFVIEGMYGLRVDFADVADVTVIEKSMRDIGAGRRTNGYGGFGETLKGNFRSDSLGEILLFVQSKTSPTVKINRSGAKDIYVSFRDGEATRELYAEMIKALSS